MTTTRIAVAALTLSASAIIGLAVHEGYRDRAYTPVPGDVPTIGFGFTEGVQPGDNTTVERALIRLLDETKKYEAGVKACADVPMYQHEFDAYVSLTYNIGIDAFCRSTLVRRLRAGDYRGACEEILKWNKFKGKTLPGLEKRRQKEYEQCLGK